MSGTSVVPTFLLDLMKLWPLFMLLSTLILGGVLLFLGTRFVTHRRCTEHRENVLAEQAKVKDLEKRVNNIGGELGALQQHIKNLPEYGDVHNILLKLEELRGSQSKLEATVAGQRELMERVEHQLDRVDTYLRGKS